MVAIDFINASILFCESEMEMCTCCIAGRREGWCVGKVLFEGLKFRVKGIYSYVNKVSGCR